jgi:hypothetical protein
MKTKHSDPFEGPWFAAAAKAWEAAEGDITRYSGPPLPAWERPAHVKREILGHYLEDRDAKVVHSVRHATAACDLDGIKNGTFYHFLREVPPGIPRCPECFA